MYIPLTPENPLGKYRKVLVARAADESIWKRRISGGGAVTALLCYLVESKTCDGVIVAKRTRGFEGEAIVARTREEILEAAGNRWSIVPFTSRLKSVLERPDLRRIAVVGLPCQVQFLSQMRTFPLLETDFSDKIYVIISLFCAGTFAHEIFLSYLKSRYGVEAKDILEMKVSGDKLIVHTEKRDIEISTREAMPYLQSGCLLCLDYTGVLADISAGASETYPHHTILITRTELGDKVIEKACSENYILVEEKPEVIEEVRKRAVDKIGRASKYALGLL